MFGISDGVNTLNVIHNLCQLLLFIIAVAFLNSDYFWMLLLSFSEELYVILHTSQSLII